VHRIGYEHFSVKRIAIDDDRVVASSWVIQGDTYSDWVTVVNLLLNLCKFHTRHAVCIVAAVLKLPQHRRKILWLIATIKGIRFAAALGATILWELEDAIYQFTLLTGAISVPVKTSNGHGNRSPTPFTALLLGN
jgi:hypothetical protein